MSEAVSTKQLLRDTEERMKKSVQSTQDDIQNFRTGRANPGLVEKVEVSYYGSTMPLAQLASITAPEARLLVVAPWDKGAIGPIEKAIQKADLGLNPSNDGVVVRLPIPQLTEETRKGLIRNVHKRVEEGKVALRNIRRDAIETLRSLKKAGDLGEDEERRTEADVQKLIDRFSDQLDQMQKNKEEELMEV